jgi:hypothetical protein
MGIRGLVLFFCVGALVAWTLPCAGQEQPSAPPATQSNSDASAKDAEENNPPANSKPAGAEPKLDLTPDASGNLSQEQMRELIRVVAQNYRDNYKKLRDYTYVERDLAHKLDGKGQVKSTETETFEIMQLYGEQVARLIEKNDKPLDDKEAAKEEEKLRKITDKRKNES